MVASSEEKSGAGPTLLFFYGIGSGISFLYFSYQFAREYGFLAWLFLGEFIPALKSLLWPLYLLMALSGK
jgi:hypothetical protein